MSINDPAGIGHNGAPPDNLTEIRHRLLLRGYKILPNRGKSPGSQSME